MPMKTTVCLLLAALLNGCGLLGLDTPSERAFDAQLTQNSAHYQANIDAQAAADKAKTDAETKAAELAASVLRRVPPEPDAGDLRMAARQLGFNRETRREYVNGALTKDVSSVVGKWRPPAGSAFEFDRQLCGLGADSSCVPGNSLRVTTKADRWHSIEFDSEDDFAAFIRDCQAADAAWKALK